MRTRRQIEQKIQEKLQEKLNNEQEKEQEHINNLQENKIDSQLSQEQAYYDLYDEIEEEIEKEEQKDLQLVDIDNLGKRKNFNYQREKGFVYSKKECNDAIIRIKNAYFLPKFRQNISQFKKNNQKLIFEKIKEDFQIIYTYAHQIISSNVNNIVIFSRKIADAYDVFKKYEDYDSFSQNWRALQAELIVQNKIKSEKCEKKDINSFYTKTDNWLVRCLQQMCLDQMNDIHLKQNMWGQYWTCWQQLINNQYWLKANNQVYHRIQNFGYYGSKNIAQKWVDKENIQYKEQKDYYNQKIEVFCYENSKNCYRQFYGCSKCYRFLNIYKQYYNCYKIRVLNLKRLKEFKIFRLEIIQDMFEQFFAQIKKVEIDQNLVVNAPVEVLEVEQQHKIQQIENKIKNDEQIQQKKNAAYIKRKEKKLNKLSSKEENDIQKKIKIQ